LASQKLKEFLILENLRNLNFRIPDGILIVLKNHRFLTRQTVAKITSLGEA